MKNKTVQFFKMPNRRPSTSLKCLNSSLAQLPGKLWSYKMAKN